MALSGQLGNAGLRADKLETAATASCEKLEAGWTVTQIHLYVRGTVPKADAAAWEKATEAAKAGCSISRLLNTAITMDAMVKNDVSNRRTTMTTKLKIPSAAKAKKYFQDKMAFTTGPVELERWFKQGEPVNIVDVRAAEDYAEGHIPGALNLPKDQWDNAKVVKARLHKNKINVLYCYSHVCHLAASAAIIFASKGYPVMELDGGWRWWKSDGFEIEK
jgi:rhodanese-related sulfurtransferase